MDTRKSSRTNFLSLVHTSRNTCCHQCWQDSRNTLAVGIHAGGVANTVLKNTSMLPTLFSRTLACCQHCSQEHQHVANTVLKNTSMLPTLFSRTPACCQHCSQEHQHVANTVLKNTSMLPTLFSRTPACCQHCSQEHQHVANTVAKTCWQQCDPGFWLHESSSRGFGWKNQHKNTLAVKPASSAEQEEREEVIKYSLKQSTNPNSWYHF